MPSVMGLLEERERAARQRVESLQVELREAEAVWERFVIARETVAEVLSLPCEGGEEPPVVVAGEGPARAVAVPGSVVPQWCEGLDVGVLAPDFQRLVKAQLERHNSSQLSQMARREPARGHGHRSGDGRQAGRQGKMNPQRSSSRTSCLGRLPVPTSSVALSPRTPNVLA
ncbi:hypothetical protein [Streptomyces sp. NPDC056549]|uniref:hypothetical protein n=1 Tax=Streptomyces sp. NPDC056549 TaxID=3345864 RepID=UPI0036987435